MRILKKSILRNVVCVAGILLIFIYDDPIKAKLLQAWNHLSDLSSTSHTKSPKSAVIFATTHCNGRLGNLLSALATLHSYERLYELVPLVKRDHADVVCHYFRCSRKRFRILEDELPGWEKDVQWTHFDPDQPYWRSILDSDDDVDLRDFLPTDYVNIGAYPAKVSYFLRDLPRLKRRFLTLKANFVRDARERLEMAREIYTRSHRVSRKGKVTFIGIHSRSDRDFQKHLRIQGLGLVRRDYFTRAMDIFRTTVKHPLFVIVGTDRRWAMRNIIPWNNDCVFLIPEKIFPIPPSQNVNNQTSGGRIDVSDDIGNDLALLTQTNYTILTYGTFGLWGALLGKRSRNVILPAGYEGNDVMAEVIAANISGWIFV